MGEPGNIDFHDFWIFGIPGNPYLWIRIYQILPENLRKFKMHTNMLGNLEFGIFRSGGLRLPLGWFAISPRTISAWVICMFRSRISRLGGLHLPLGWFAASAKWSPTLQHSYGKCLNTRM